MPRWLPMCERARARVCVTVSVSINIRCELRSRRPNTVAHFVCWFMIRAHFVSHFTFSCLSVDLFLCSVRHDSWKFIRSVVPFRFRVRLRARWQSYLSPIYSFICYYIRPCDAYINKIHTVCKSFLVTSPAQKWLHWTVLTLARRMCPCTPATKMNGVCTPRPTCTLSIDL